MTQTQTTTAIVANAIQALAEHLVDPGAVLAAISEQSIDSWPIVDGALVIEPDMWHADDGNAEIIGEYDSGLEAAQAYVDDGEWGEDTGTFRITVHVWQIGIEGDGTLVRVNEDSHKITVEPEEPKCTADEHDWQSPIEIVGGIKENPGVYGHGGGVTIQEVCLHCGCGKLTDTWAQDRYDGEQGLTSVQYEPGKYSDEVAAAQEQEGI